MAQTIRGAAVGALVALAVAMFGVQSPASAESQIETASSTWAPVQAAIAAGSRFTCVITAAGGVKCWGANSLGQLGDGTNTNSLTPVDVTGLSSGVRQISAGYGHVCAVTSGNGVKCWGDNDDGELGTGTAGGTSNVPVDVAGLTSGVSQVSAGDGHTCALLLSGAVQCWGVNANGQVGDGSTTSRLSPVTVIASGASGIDARYYQTCALMTNNRAKCWGTNGEGEAGNVPVAVSPSDELSPVDVTAVTGDIAALSVGYARVCVVMKTDGALKCWGSNSTGGLGDGSGTSYRSGVTVTGLASGVATVSATEGFSCALTTAGGVKCWGDNAPGLGDGSGSSATPVDVTGLSSGVVAVTVSENHAIAVLASGEMKAWGRNGAGQLGDGTTTNRPEPVTSAPGLSLPQPASPTTTTTAAPTTTTAPTTTASPTTTTAERPAENDQEVVASENLPETGAGSLTAVVALLFTAAGVLVVRRRQLTA